MAYEVNDRNFERMMKSEPQNSMYVVRAPKLLGVLAQRPIRVGTLFEDFKEITQNKIKKYHPLPCRPRFRPDYYPTCFRKILNKNT